MIRVSAIDHVNLQVSDLVASIDSCRRAFGFKALEDGRGIPAGGWAIVGLPGAVYLALGVTKDSSPAQGKRMAHLRDLDGHEIELTTRFGGGLE